MAYAAAITGPTTRLLSNGKALHTWKIVETDVGVADEWGGGGVAGELNAPAGARFVYTETEITTPDAASTVNPELRTEPAATTDARHDLDAAGGAVAVYAKRADVRLRITDGEQKLYGKSVVDAHADEVTSFVTLEVG